MPAALTHGDRVKLRFDPPVLEDDGTCFHGATGEILQAAGQTFVADEIHKSRMGQPHILRIDDHEGVYILFHETAQTKLTRIKRERRGKLVFDAPATRSDDIRDQIETLAELIAAEPKTHSLHSRRDGLLLQFHDLCDHICLAQAKRTYMLTRARVGEDFHPWETRDPRVMRIETVRPIPADFELTRKERGDRARRLEETVHIFGEAERETRRIGAALRAAGHDVRRPHPQAQELLIRIEMGEARIPMRSDILLKSSANGFWHASAAAPQNKKEARARARMLREGHLERLRTALNTL